MSFIKLGAPTSKKIPRNVFQSCRTYTESRARRTGQESRTAAERVPLGHSVANRITLYGVPDYTTPGDVRRAIAGKLTGVLDVQIDYKSFLPSGKAHITLSDANLLGTSLRALRPSVSVSGLQVTPVAQYSSEIPTLHRIRGAKGLSEAVDRGIINGHGPSGNFPNVERNVVLWGMPGRVTVEDVAKAIAGFKVEKKGTQPIIIKLEKPDKFTRFARFIVTMASVSEAHRLVRAWHLTPWITNSPDLIRARVLS